MKATSLLPATAWLGFLAIQLPPLAGSEPGFTRHTFRPSPGTRTDFAAKAGGKEGRVVAFRPPGDEVLFFIEGKGGDPEGHLPVRIIRLNSEGRLTDIGPRGEVGIELDLLVYFILFSFEGPPLTPGASWQSDEGTVVEGIPIEGRLERSIEEVPGKPGLIRVVSRRNGKDILSPGETLIIFERTYSATIETKTSRVIAVVHEARHAPNSPPFKSSIEEMSWKALGAREAGTLAVEISKIREVIDASNWKKPSGLLDGLLTQAPRGPPLDLLAEYEKAYPKGFLKEVVEPLRKYLREKPEVERKQAVWREKNRRADELPEHPPDFTLRDLSGTPVSLSDQRGKVVVLSFLKPGVGTSTSLAIVLSEIDEKYVGKGLVVIGVSVAMEGEDAEFGALAKDMSLRQKVLLGGKSIAEKYLVEKPPTTFVFDRSGKLKKRIDDYSPNSTPWEIEEAVEKLLEK